MPPRLSRALVSPSNSNSFNLTSLLAALPSRHPDTFTKCSSCLFSTTHQPQMKRGGRKRTNQKKDPYRVAQAAQRKTANLEKRRVLQAERAAALGDPVYSKPTPFLNSLNLVPSVPDPRYARASPTSTPTAPTAAGSPTGETYLNYTLTPSTTDTQLSHSKWLTEPLLPRGGAPHDPGAHAQRLKLHESQHENARRAITNITSLVNSNSKDRTRINIRRCIDTFGRHTTDSILPPKPSSLGSTPSSSSSASSATEPPSSPTPEEAERLALLSELQSIPTRAGPDTGSSEVQIAILTTKINVLAQNLRNGDKHNKRNLRLLVHRRQKLLNYLRRKERGGPRWQHLVDMLGINDAMWKGEISLA